MLYAAAMLHWKPGMPLYHGTFHDFPKPKLGRGGAFWTTPDPAIAAKYARPYYVRKPEVFAWEVHLSPSAKVFNLRDLSQRPIRALFDAINEARHYSLFGPWSEEYWARNADFGNLEANLWAAGFLRKKKVDALIIADVQGTSREEHESVAILRMGAIESLQRVVIVGR